MKTFKLKLSTGLILIFFLNLLFSLFIDRSLIANLSRNLPDWYDHAYIVWTIFQNIAHLRALDFSHFFQTNAFYPFQGTLLFSDLLLPESLFGLIFSYFTANPILIFNLIGLVTLILNVISSIFLWRSFLKPSLLLFFAVLITANSPFVILTNGHFQILNIWPTMFCLGYVFRSKFTLRNGLAIGFWLSVQFLSSVYLAIMSFFAISLWYFLKLWTYRTERQKVVAILKNALLVALTVTLMSGLFVYKYIGVKNTYHIERAYWEYVIYSSQITDYIFTADYRSLIGEIPLVKRWNSLQKHGGNGEFPGFALLSLAILGAFYINKSDKIKNLAFKLSPENIYFLTIAAAGFFFSLGPRLSVNGTYFGIPLPYYPVLKFLPLVEPIRAPSRWSILFYLALSYFALIGLNKVVKSNKKGLALLILISAFYSFEIIPFSRQSEYKNYYPEEYWVVAQSCAKEPKVLIELPLSEDKKGADIFTNLTYRTQLMLASVKHKCQIVNGYSGYIPKDYENYETNLYMALSGGDQKAFWSLLSQRNVKIIKFNKKEIYPEKADLAVKWIKANNQLNVLEEDSSYIIAEYK